MRRLGDSANWREKAEGYFTMDAKMSRAVVEVFLRLYEEGLIYRGKRLLNCHPDLHTAVSDLDVNTQEQDHSLYAIPSPYPAFITTAPPPRPHTLLPHLP